jgi:hypothetical protein
MILRRIGQISLLTFWCIFGITAFSSSQVADQEMKIGLQKQDFQSNNTGITFDKSGYMYVATVGDNPIKYILKINNNQDRDTICSIECFAIQFLKAAPDNSILASVVIERGKNNSQLLKISGKNTITIISDGFIQPVGMTFDSGNNLYLVDAFLKKVFRLTADNKKSIFIDMTRFQVSKEVLYHGIDFNKDKNLLFLSGINIIGGKGNLLMFRIDPSGQVTDPPTVIFDGNCKHVITHKDLLFATVNTNSLLIKDLISGSSKIIDDKLLTNGMTMSFGTGDFGEEKLYINAFDRIVTLF